MIDGLQRLYSLKKFAIDKTLALKGLDFLDIQWREWPFSYEDFERVAHGLNISMEFFK